MSPPARRIGGTSHQLNTQKTGPHPQGTGWNGGQLAKAGLFGKRFWLAFPHPYDGRAGNNLASGKRRYNGPDMSHPSFLSASLYVAIGGGMGAWLRLVTGRLFVHWLGPTKASAFPWSTLTVNVLGSLFMGVLVGWLARHGTGSGLSSEGSRLLLAVGMLGGFTTFSSFSLEVVNIAERGQIGLAAAYAAISVIAGVAGLMIGLMMMRATI